MGDADRIRKFCILGFESRYTLVYKGSNFVNLSNQDPLPWLFSILVSPNKKLYNSSIMAQNKYFGKPSEMPDHKRFTSWEGMDASTSLFLESYSTIKILLYLLSDI